MGGFVLAAAVLVAATLLLLLRPWRRAPKQGTPTAREINAGVHRDQLLELDRDLATGTISASDHAQARAELQRRLLDDASAGELAADTSHGTRFTSLAMVLTLPLAAAGLYAWLGSPAALDPSARASVATQDAKPAVTQETVEKMVADLAAKLEKDPSDTKGWVMLARANRAMGRYQEADYAFGRAGDELNQDPHLLAEYADVLATLAQGKFDGKPMELVNRALKLDPQNPMALSLAATAAYNRGDVAQAIAHWEHLQRLVSPESDDGKWLAQTLAQVRGQAGGPAAASQTVAATAEDKAAPAATAADHSISGRVSLAPALSANVQPTDTVFVFARAPQGPRMPLAVQRARVSDLPLDFKLDDSMAMSPEFKISGAAEVRIEARISRSGSATPGPGDLIGVGPVVKPGTGKVTVLIDQVRP